MKEKLDLIEVPDILHPRIATSKLNGFTHSWWMTHSNMMEMSLWEVFRKEFDNQFILDAY